MEFTGHTADLPGFARISLIGINARGREADLAAWNDASRLNPAQSIMSHLDDPRVTDAFSSLGAHIGPAAENLDRLTGNAN